MGRFGRLLVSGKTIEQIRDEAQRLIDWHLQQELRDNFQIEQNDRAVRRNLSDQYAKKPSKKSDDDEPELDLDTDNDFNREARARQERQIVLDRSITEAIRNNEVSARLVNWDSKKIYVLGEVSSPGSFLYTGHQNVLDAIIEAGGMTSKANRHEVIVSRPSSCSDCKVVMKICYDQIVQLGDASTNYQLMPGDRVFVPSLTFCDDVRQTLQGGSYNSCPKCVGCPTGCELPQGCE